MLKADWSGAGSAARTMMGALRLYPLDAGKSLSFRHTWNQQADTGRLVPPGDYTIRGVLLTDDPKGLRLAPGAASCGNLSPLPGHR
jgi:hypothetical protein